MKQPSLSSDATTNETSDNAISSKSSKFIGKINKQLKKPKLKIFDNSFTSANGNNKNNDISNNNNTYSNDNGKNSDSNDINRNFEEWKNKIVSKERQEETMELMQLLSKYALLLFMALLSTSFFGVGM